MKVSELISELERMPQDAEVFIDGREWERIDQVFTEKGEVFISKE